MPLTNRTKAEVLLVLITFVWGTTFVVVKEALTDASPLPFLALRFTLAGALLFFFLGRGRTDQKALPAGAALGLFLFGGFFFQTLGQVYTTPSKCAFITGFSVVLVPIIMMFRGARLRNASLAGGLLGLLGLYFLVLPSGMAAVNRGDVYTLVASVSFAVHIVLVGSYAQRYSFRLLVPLQVCAVGILAITLLPLDSARRLDWTPQLAGALAITSVLSTGFAFSVQNWAQQFTPPAHTALIFALEPVFAAMASRVFLGERLGGKVLLGSALILAGMVISELWGGAAPTPVEG